jgi:hypothetical protein
MMPLPAAPPLRQPVESALPPIVAGYPAQPLAPLRPLGRSTSNGGYFGLTPARTTSAARTPTAGGGGGGGGGQASRLLWRGALGLADGSALDGPSSPLRCLQLLSLIQAGPPAALYHAQRTRLRLPLDFSWRNRQRHEDRRRLAGRERQRRRHPTRSSHLQPLLALGRPSLERSPAAAGNADSLSPS